MTMGDIKSFHKLVSGTYTSKSPVTKIEAKNPGIDQLLAHVWIGIVLSLVLLTCICCMCSCFLYHKFQQWKHSVLSNNEDLDISTLSATPIDAESPPSYTLASGLPSYEEAMTRVQADEKINKKSINLFKDISTGSGMTQPTCKVPIINCIPSHVHEKT